MPASPWIDPRVKGCWTGAKMSEDHINKPVATVVDGKVIAAPVVRVKLGASISISGHFTEDEVQTIVKAIGGK